MRQTNVSNSSLFYSEHQIVYSLRVKRSHMSKVYNHKGKPHRADELYITKNFFFRSIETLNNNLS